MIVDLRISPVCISTISGQLVTLLFLTNKNLEKMGGFLSQEPQRKSKEADRHHNFQFLRLRIMVKQIKKRQTETLISRSLNIEDKHCLKKTAFGAEDEATRI